MLRMQMVNKFGDDFSISVRLESIALLHQKQLHVLVISDDSWTNKQMSRGLR